MVALTGIEPVNFQFSSVQLGLSRCFRYSSYCEKSKNAPWTPDVVTRLSLAGENPSISLIVICCVREDVLGARLEGRVLLALPGHGVRRCVR